MDFPFFPGGVFAKVKHFSSHKVQALPQQEIFRFRIWSVPEPNRFNKQAAMRRPEPVVASPVRTFFRL
jgi:hypothetical protein